MITKRAFLTTLAGGVASAALLSNTGIAKAERVFDPGVGGWVEVKRNGRRSPPAKYNRRSVRIKTSLAANTVIIDTDKKFLYHYHGNGKATRYGVGVGREGFEWQGNASIRRKAEWPTWTPPAEMRVRERKKGIILPASMKGGIDNPLGARAMYLYKGGRDTLYRIHGTNQPWTIGQNMSSGCIRMVNKDVEHLYKNVKIGTKVKVLTGNTSKVYTEQRGLLSIFAGG